MSRSPEAVYLRESLDELVRALGHLEYAAEACGGLPTDVKVLSERELLDVEAFTGRFARTIDLLTKRVLRSLDHFELYDAGTRQPCRKTRSHRVRRLVARAEGHPQPHRP